MSAPIPRRAPIAELTLEFGMIMFLFLTPITIAGSEIALGIAAVAWVAGAARRAARRKAEPGFRPSASALDRLTGPARPILLPLLLLAAAMVVASAFALDPAASFPKLKKLLLALALFLFAAGVRDGHRARRLLAALILGAIVSSTYGIAAYFQGEGGLSARLGGASGFYMTTAGILMLTLVFLVPLLLVPSTTRARAALLLGLGVVAWALLMTYTRGAWLGVLGAAFVTLLLMKPRLLAPFAILVVIGFFLMPAPVQQRVRSITDPEHPLNHERISMWRAGASMLREDPWTGAGLMDLKSHFEKHAGPGYEGVIHGHLHSNFVQIAAATGIPGLVAFLILLGSIARALGRGLRSASSPAGRALVVGGFAALAAFLIEGMFEWNFGDAEVVTLWYALTGLAIAAPGWDRETADEPG